jgi:hypothetical protein
MKYLLVIIILILFTTTVSAQNPTPELMRVMLPIIIKSHILQRMSDNTGTCEDMTQSAQYYNWSAYPTGCATPFIPMIWGPGNLHDTYQVSQARQYPIILGFNEPNIDDPSAGHYQTISELVANWHEFESTFDHYTSPSFCCQHSCPNLSYYLLDFVDAYYAQYDVYPTFDIVTLHFYGTDAKGDAYVNFNAFEAYIESVRTGLSNRGYGDIPIWITELGYWSTAMDRNTQAALFVSLCIGYLRGVEQVDYVCWFGVRPVGLDYVVTLYDENGITEVGEVWNSW